MEFKHKSVLLEETIDGLNVKADGIDGGDPLAEHVAELVLHGPALLELVLVEGPDAPRGGLEGVPLVPGERFEGVEHLLARHDGVFHRLQAEAVEAVRVLDHRLVAAGGDVLDDRLGTAGDFGIDRRVAGDELRELRLKILVLSG